MRTRIDKSAKSALAILIAAIMLVFTPTPVSAVELSELEIGKTYRVSASLNCYVDAMGGVEFGTLIFRSMTVSLDEAGDAYATIYFGTGTGNIYTVDFAAFVDPLIYPGVYLSTGGLSRVGVTYTTSANSARNGDGELVNYVDSMTFPVDSFRSTYYLYIYVNSNVMGVQFCDGSGSASSGNPGVSTPYRAVLSVDWNNLSEGAAMLGSSGRTSNVIYDSGSTIGAFEVEIPAIIVVDGATKKAIYTVRTSENFDLPEGSFVTVSAEEAGTLLNDSGSDTVEHINDLPRKELISAGDEVNGMLTVTGNPVTHETYTGTLQFVISLYHGEE